MMTKTLEYNKKTTKITLNTYDDGFFLSEITITDAVLTLALEKLYDDYGLEQGDEFISLKRKAWEVLRKLSWKSDYFLKLGFVRLLHNIENKAKFISFLFAPHLCKGLS